MEKNMENEMETGNTMGHIGFVGFRDLGFRFQGLVPRMLELLLLGFKEIPEDQSSRRFYRPTP